MIHFEILVRAFYQDIIGHGIDIGMSTECHGNITFFIDKLNKPAKIK